MLYELNAKSNNDYKAFDDQIRNNILSLRNIEDIKSYYNPNEKNEHDYKLLNNIDKAVRCFLDHVSDNHRMIVIVDEDTDGITSSAILYNYCCKVFPNIKLKYIMHTKRKTHGLSIDIMKELSEYDDIRLVLLPDAGSNDVKQCKNLKNKNIDIIILDHHESDDVPKDAIVVNNQLCNYPNKSLSGVGIVYKFLQALDDELWINYSKDYIDMVMLGLVADSMDVRNLETKYYIDMGLKNIKNKQLKELIDRMAFKLKDSLNMINIAFYIAPLINAMIRSGTFDDRKLMFEGFLQRMEYFNYKPRGSSEFVRESIYEKVARLCLSTKQRQDKARNKAFMEIEKEIYKRNKTGDKILIINCNNKFDNSLTGVVAIKVANKYNKPVLLLHKSENENINKDNDRNLEEDNIYIGSGRNTDKNAIKDFKKFLNESELFINNEGHPQAFGSSIYKNNISKFLQYAQERLKNINFDSNYYVVDYIIPFDELSDVFIFNIDSMKNLWGKNVAESLIAVENIEVKSSDIKIVGKKVDTMVFNIDDISFIKFFISEDEELIKKCSILDEENKSFILNIVGKCSSNIWNKEKKPQIIIQDYNIVKEY